MPRHTSHSSAVLGDYISLFGPTTATASATPSRSQSRAASPTPRRSSVATAKNTQIQYDLESNAPQSSTTNYADVGRLITLVNEMELLRKLVDSLIVDSHVNPTAKAMFPQWSIPITTKSPVTRWRPRTGSRPVSRALSWGGPGSRKNSWALARTGSKVIPQLPARPELARGRPSTDRWQLGCRDSRHGSDPSNLV